MSVLLLHQHHTGTGDLRPVSMLVFCTVTTHGLAVKYPCFMAEDAGSMFP